MELRKLNVGDVSKILLKNDYPHDLIQKLAVNGIDGEALYSLIDDFQEFQHLVPQSVWRMKLKKIVHSNSDTSSKDPFCFCPTSLSSLVVEPAESQTNRSNSMKSPESQMDSFHISSSSFVEDKEEPSTSQMESTGSSPTSRPITLSSSKASSPHSSKTSSPHSSKTSSPHSSKTSSPHSSKTSSPCPSYFITRKVHAGEEVPFPFPFPRHFPAEVELGLSRNTLTRIQLAKLYTEIANVILTYKLYPTRREYEQVAQQMLDKYPLLASRMGKNAIDQITKAFKERFYCFRKKSSLCAPVQSPPAAASDKGLKRGKGKKTPKPSKRVCKEVDHTDKENSSFKRQCILLQSEYRKVQPDKATVCETMEISFEMRRSDILTNARPIGHVLKDYPFLKDQHQILSEMYRIIQKPVEHWKWTEVWLPKLLHLCTTNLSGDKQVRARQLLDSHNGLRDSDIDVTIGLLKLLPFLIPDYGFQPAVDKFINSIPTSSNAIVAASNFGQTYAAPYLLVKEDVDVEEQEEEAEIFLTIGRHVLCKIPATLATLYLLTGFYVFNIDYPKGLTNLYALLEKITLDEHERKTTQAVRRIYSSLAVMD